MKRKFSLFTLIILVCISMCNYSCNNTTKIDEDYDTCVEHSINALKPPVILIGKSKSFGRFSITVKDANDSIRYYGNMSGLANSIGESQKIGDTIK